MACSPFQAKIIVPENEKKHRNTLAMGVSMLFMCVEIFLVQFLLRQYLGQVKDKRSQQGLKYGCQYHEEEKLPRHQIRLAYH